MPYTIILASASPRRQALLQALGWAFEVVLKPIDEAYPSHLKGVEITDYLAQKKATPFTDTLQPTDILITSDTIVWNENRALGKPKNDQEAFEMLSSLSGKSHKVITSVCITQNSRQTVFSDQATVWFRNLTQKEINHYIKECTPYNKAGGYGIQDWIGHVAITRIEGAYNTVIGFPTHLIYSELQKICKKNEK